MKKNKIKLSVCIPVYNNAPTIEEAAKSILNQTYKHFELVIVDDCSKDNSVEIIKKIKDKRIKLYRNKKNKGCGGNLMECARRAKGETIFYVCGDDLIDKNSLALVMKAFDRSEDVGIVTRPYYWFDESLDKPVRVTRQFDREVVVSVGSSFSKITDVIALADQISGIGLRKKFMEKEFSNDSFIEMGSMVVPMIKKCKAVILSKNLVAARIAFSGSKESKAYIRSPMMAWYGLIVKTFSKPEHRKLKKYLIHNFIANNYIGLVQIKNFGNWRQLFREIYFLIKLRIKNLITWQFWFFTLGTILMPRQLLRELVIFYKNKINYRLIGKEEIVLDL